MKRHEVTISRIEIVRGTVWLHDDVEPSQLTDDDWLDSMETVEYTTGPWLVAASEVVTEDDQAGAA